eukprot:COSAG01_NODE_2503_length_7555_cov_3.547881_4_plen_180_part_00
MKNKLEKKYCFECGYHLSYVVPVDDVLPRYLCQRCGYVHYVNPKIITGVLPVWENKILLCKRGIEPRKHKWTLPAGFMELNETPEEGALREAQEEAFIDCDISHLHCVYSSKMYSQVYLIYLARLKQSTYKLTSESVEIALLSKVDVLKKDIAFKSVEFAIQSYDDACWRDRRVHCYSI